MTDVYVNSGATGGTYDGTTKATAYQTIATAMSAAPAGANIWVHKAHSETTSAAAMTLAATNGTSNASRLNIACVDFAGSTPPAAADLSTGAVVGPTSAYALTMTGTFSSRGVAYSGLSINLGTTSAGIDAIFDPSTVLKLASPSGTSASINFGANVVGIPYRVDLNSAQIASALTATGTQSICTVYNCAVTWRAGSVSLASTTPTLNLFTAKGGASILAEGVDLSGLGATNRFIFATPTAAFKADIKDCKVPASYGGVLAGSLVPGSRVRVTRGGSAAGAYGQQIYVPEGSAIDELSVTLPGGLSDGVTPKSRKLVASASSYASPLVDSVGTIWNAQTGSAVTVSIEVLAPTGSTNGDLWLDVEGLVDTGDPLGGIASSGRASLLDAAVALPASTATWSNAPNGFSAYKLQRTFTAAQAGPLSLRVKAATAATYYADGKPSISGAPAAVSRSYVGPEGTLIHETQATVTQTVNVLVPGPGRARSR